MDLSSSHAVDWQHLFKDIRTSTAAHRCNIRHACNTCHSNTSH